MARSINDPTYGLRLRRPNERLFFLILLVCWSFYSNLIQDSVDKASQYEQDRRDSR